MSENIRSATVLQGAAHDINTCMWLGVVFIAPSGEGIERLLYLISVNSIPR
jgi:hypothetical protein